MNHISDEKLEELANRAAQKAVERALQQMYVEIGRGVLRKAAWVIGVGVVALGVWLNTHGFK